MMRLYFFLSIQTLAITSPVHSLSSLRNRGPEKTRKQESVDNELFDCEKGCSLTVDGPVCGDDGVSYQTQCLAYCQNVSVENVGECSGHAPMNDDTYDNTAEITKEQLDRFKGETFVFVAKRNFENYQSVTKEGEGTTFESPLSNKKVDSDKDVIYAHRVTHDGYEYLAKINVKDTDLDSGFSLPQPPLGVTSSTRTLKENERGIVGSDSRSKVCLRESCYPFSAIGEFGSATEKGGCTGTVISPSTVITNAHCRYTNGGFTDLNYFAPGRYRKYATPIDPTDDGGDDEGEVVNPYGEWKVQLWTVFSNFFMEEELKYDIALATFSQDLYRGNARGSNDLNIGEITGYMGIAATTNNSTELQKATLTGYPYDKKDGEMWTSGPCAGGFQNGYDKVITYHGCDSVKGNDGSALLDLESKIVYGLDVAQAPVSEDNPDQVFVSLGVIFHETNIRLVKMMAGIR